MAVCVQHFGQMCGFFSINKGGLGWIGTCCIRQFERSASITIENEELFIVLVHKKLF